MTGGGPDDPVRATAVNDPETLAADGPAASDPWPVVDTDVVWENPYFTAGYDVVERPDGETGTYYWVDPADVVAVVAETADGKVVMVEQYAPRLRQSLLSCPGGGLEDGESFVDAALRELREETGFRAGEAELLTVYRPSTWLRMDQAVVYATDLDPGPAERDPGEFIDVYAAPVESVLDALDSRPRPFGPAVQSILVAREYGVL